MHQAARVWLHAGHGGPRRSALCRGPLGGVFPTAVGGHFHSIPLLGGQHSPGCTAGGLLGASFGLCCYPCTRPFSSGYECGSPYWHSLSRWLLPGCGAQYGFSLGTLAPALCHKLAVCLSPNGAWCPAQRAWFVLSMARGGCIGHFFLKDKSVTAGMMHPWTGSLAASTAGVRLLALGIRSRCLQA